MNATELFKAGKLHAAIDAQIQAVKNKPADHGARIFLFELFSFAGDIDRAQRQIDAVKYDEVERDASVQYYRKVLDAERSRRRLFAEGLQPKFFGDAPEHATLRLKALDAVRGKQMVQALELFGRADQAAPPLKGELNGKEFDGLRDSDDRFGPILEVMAHGEFYWVPFEQIDTLALNPPKFPRDLIWAPARLEIRDGPAGEVFLPALYPGSHERPEEEIKLGRLTDWSKADDGPVHGVGQRLFLVGDEDISVLDWRQLQMA